MITIKVFKDQKVDFYKLLDSKGIIYEKFISPFGIYFFAELSIEQFIYNDVTMLLKNISFETF